MSAPTSGPGKRTIIVFLFIIVATIVSLGYYSYKLMVRTIYLPPEYEVSMTALDGLYPPPSPFGFFDFESSVWERLRAGHALDLVSRLAMGRYCLSRGWYGRSFEYLTYATEPWDNLESFAQDKSHASSLAVLLDILNQHEVAARLHERALSMEPAGSGTIAAVQTRLHINYGRHLLLVNDNSRALEQFDRARELAGASHDSLEIAAALSGIGQAYAAQQVEQRATNAHQRALSIYARAKLNDRQARELINLARLSIYMEKLDQAKSELNEALMFCEQVANDTVVTVDCLKWLGIVSEMQGDRASALEYARRRLELVQAFNHHFGITECLADIANLFAHDSIFDSAQVYRDFTEKAVERYWWGRFESLVELWQSPIEVAP